MIFIKTALLECINERYVSKYTIMLYYTMTVLLEYIDRSLKFSKMRDIAINICLHFPIMLALCLMLSMTCYAQSYAGIIGGSL